VAARTAVTSSLLLLTVAAWATQKDPCAATTPSASDVQFTLALKDGNAVFQRGEIVSLVLSFTATTKTRYWADVRNYDRSGRLGIETYCVEPKAPDPLESYFKVGGFIGGGIGSTRELDATPLTAEAELNEWRTMEPGHYRVYAISHRLWRAPAPTEQTPRVTEVVRSNAVEFDVRPPDLKWQDQQLLSALRALAGPSSTQEFHSATRRLRFLNTEDSTRQLARLYWGLNEQQAEGWDLMLGLFGSPYRSLAIDSMREQIALPDHAITAAFLHTLANLEVSADASWDAAPADALLEASREFWRRRQVHVEEVTKLETAKAVAAVPGKSGKARALTLSDLLTAGRGDRAKVDSIRPALIAAWADLPRATQAQLIQYRWPLIAGPEMLPILRGIAEEAPPYPRTEAAMTRDAALKHIQDLDPAAGRELILRDVQNQKAQPSIELVGLLPKDDIETVTQSAVERIGRHQARELDFKLVDRYADAAALGPVREIFEEHVGKWACALQSAMLRYFLRVDPAYGVRQVTACLGERKDTGCYRALLEDLGGFLPIVQESAIRALDDSDAEVVEDAARALGRWGSADAEAALWWRLQQFHQTWAGRGGELHSTPDSKDPGSQGAALEHTLMSAIVTGSGWTCPADKLARLAELVWSKQGALEIGGWLKRWTQGAGVVQPMRSPEGKWTFSVVQYGSLTEEQLRVKLAQFPRGTKLLWQSWQPGQNSPPGIMAEQEALFERMRNVAQTNLVSLGKVSRTETTDGDVAN
jgi:hypothetical protein